MREIGKWILEAFGILVATWNSCGNLHSSHDYVVGWGGWDSASDSREDASGPTSKCCGSSTRRAPAEDILARVSEPENVNIDWHKGGPKRSRRYGSTNNRLRHSCVKNL